MKKIKLLLVFTLLTIMMSGCQANTAAPATDSATEVNVEVEPEATTISEDEINEFMVSYYDAMIEKNKEYLILTYDVRLPDAEAEQFAVTAIDGVFRANIKSAEIFIKSVKPIERDGEKYYAVDHSLILTNKNGETQSGEELVYLVETESKDLKILVKGYTGNVVDLKSVPHKSNGSMSIDFLNASDYLQQTMVNFEATNTSEELLGFGVMELEYSVFVEMKDGEVFEVNITDKKTLKKGEKLSWSGLLNIPYNEFLENVQFVYINNVDVIKPSTGMPYLGEESFVFLLYSSGDDAKRYLDKANSF